MTTAVENPPCSVRERLGLEGDAECRLLRMRQAATLSRNYSVAAGSARTIGQLEKMSLHRKGVFWITASTSAAIQVAGRTFSRVFTPRTASQ